ncbi:MAG: hypothetical protein ABR498_05940, partial [Candidatus Dormibacteria bacterium]
MANKTNTITATQSSPNGGTVTLTARYTENVYRDPNSVYSAQCGTSCLTWIVQVTNCDASTTPSCTPPSNDAIDRITIANFSGFQTDIGYNTNGVPAGQDTGLSNSGTQSPVTVSRGGSSPQGNGSVLRWTFSGTDASGNGVNKDIQPGQTTVLLEVETNATQYTGGSLTVQDGASVSGEAVSPAVPEAWTPASNLVAQIFEPMSRGTVDFFENVFLWSHLLLIFGFLAYIPYSKHLHIFVSEINVFFTKTKP